MSSHGSGLASPLVGRGFSQLGYGVILYYVEDKALPDFTNDLGQAIRNSNAYITCVPTPKLADGNIDPSCPSSIIGQTGAAVKDKDQYNLTGVKGTVLPVTTEYSIVPELQRIPHRVDNCRDDQVPYRLHAVDQGFLRERCVPDL